MTRRFYYFVRAIFLFVSCLAPVLLLEAQGGKQTLPGVPLIDSDADPVKQRNLIKLRDDEYLKPDEQTYDGTSYARIPGAGVSMKSNCGGSPGGWRAMKESEVW